MANRMINLESDYEYVTGSIMGNIMNLQAAFSSMEWAKEDLEIISKELVHTGKLFAAQQGLGGVSQIQDVSVNGTRVYINRKNHTGTLINSIKAEPNGNTVVFWNDANLGRGYYAGHIEYGFHDRGGNPIAARPFMRPAFQAVARASMGDISGTLYSFLQGNMIQNTTATFGTPLTSGGGKRAFYNQPTRGPNRGLYTVSGLRGRNAQSNWKGAISKLRDKGTVRNGGNQKGFIHTRNTLNKHGFTSFTITHGKSKHLGSYADTSSIKVGTGKSYSRNKNTNLSPRSPTTQRIGRANSATDHSYRGGVQASSHYNRDSAQARKNQFSGSSKSSSTKSKKNSSKYLKDVYVIKGNTEQKVSLLPIKDYLTKYELTTPSRAVSNKYGKNKVYLREK